MMRRVLCYGDSNTYGYDPRSYLGGRYPETVRWTARLSPRWEVINEGANGRTIPQWEGEIDSNVRMLCRREADAVTVMLGTNDLLQGLTPRLCGERMERFLSALISALNGCPLLLIAPPPVTRGLWVEDDALIARSRTLAPCYADTARRLGIAFADAGEWDIALTGDGVHFSDAACIIGTNQSPRGRAAICPYFSCFQSIWRRHTR